MKRLIALVAGLALLLTGCGSDDTTGSDSTGGGTITVFAAASLKASFEEMAPLFKEKTGTEVTFSFLGSQDLVSNLAGGAAADVLATADEKSMTSATEQNLVGESKIFAANTLVLVTPPGNPAGITGLDSSLEGKKLVICDEVVPCGNATNTLAEQLGVTLNPVSKEEKVSDVLAKITTGEGDAGVVYATDASNAGSEVETVQIEGADQVVNKYPIALTAEPANSASGQAFVDFVLSDEGQAVLAKYGFAKP
ncbi:molybdate ABC transporter substrate-binding protein [Propionibacteriaceae bacterium Y1923]